MPALERALATIRSHNDRNKGLPSDNKSHRIRAKRLTCDFGEMVNGEELQVLYVRDKAECEEEEKVHEERDNQTLGTRKWPDL
jgi:hypothetical protein